MNYTLLVLTVIFAFIEWTAVLKRWRIFEYFFKPAVIPTIIIWLITSGSLSQHQSLLFTIGAVFWVGEGFGRFFLKAPDGSTYAIQQVPE